MSDIEFTPGQVKDALRGFDKNKASSPDYIPMMFFMNLSLSLSLRLSILFNKSLKERKFPTRWKTGFVSPIFKEGNKNDVMNYRPISVLCAVSKVFERLVFVKLFDAVKSSIHHSQHGKVDRDESYGVCFECRRCHCVRWSSRYSLHGLHESV